MRIRGSAATLLALALLGTGGALPSAPASAQGLGAERGRVLAQEFCARCHAISAAQERPGEADAPSFRRLAANPRWTRAALIEMMTVPHVNMPPPVLTPDEAAEVAAYIQSLR